MLIPRDKAVIFFYIETNFLIGYAKDQDKDAEILLNILKSLPLLKILIPSVSCMEALSVLENEGGTRNYFEQILDKEIKKLQNNVKSQYSKQICTSLDSAIVSNVAMAADINDRLFQVLGWVAQDVELIQLEQSGLKASLDNELISDPTDNLILHSILNHSNQNSDVTKVFLSNNSSDFGTKEIKTVLTSAGMQKYLSTTKDFLLPSQSMIGCVGGVGAAPP
jgi:PIN domain